ncbi:MAG: membrane protein [Candidatus Amesbacteria bacterium GW2011_GWA2_42_12]|uniref:GtrA/DPMS transmembrane domain-containing protein n=2 Tax=Patescibacteria group TaxID=1783273 RepID=A0A1F6NJJ3_9BACT|nr:MAG: membrane protein [Candidatus Amesbacteria bacterium GW2011_GWA2_42_12]OGH84226.1 MAG: hypothetical protein A2261_04390 [Candidatus Magasanikbacteria bacterium RIFOXYA2_FULL_44_8]
MRKIFSYLYSVRKQFLNYFITGISGTILDIGLLFLFTNVGHMRPVFAVMINQLVVFGYIFLLNKYWTFRATGTTHKQVMRFLVVYAGNYCIAVAWMWLFTERFNFGANLGHIYLLLEVYYNILVRMANIALSICWNFLIYKYFVYRSEPLRSDSSGSIE